MNTKNSEINITNSDTRNICVKVNNLFSFLDDPTNSFVCLSRKESGQFKFRVYSCAGILKYEIEGNGIHELLNKISDLKEL